MMHTPGPWKYVESLFHWIRAGDNTPIAIMKTPGPNVVANAALIAAAPELLEACEAGIKALLIAGFYLENVPDEYMKVIDDGYTLLDAATRKAKGNDHEEND